MNSSAKHSYTWEPHVEVDLEIEKDDSHVATSAWMMVLLFIFKMVQRYMYSTKTGMTRRLEAPLWPLLPWFRWAPWTRAGNLACIKLISSKGKPLGSRKPLGSHMVGWKSMDWKSSAQGHSLEHYSGLRRLHLEILMRFRLRLGV